MTAEGSGLPERGAGGANRAGVTNGPGPSADRPVSWRLVFLAFGWSFFAVSLILDVVSGEVADAALKVLIIGTTMLGLHLYGSGRT